MALNKHALLVDALFSADAVWLPFLHRAVPVIYLVWGMFENSVTKQLNIQGYKNILRISLCPLNRLQHHPPLKTHNFSRKESVFATHLLSQDLL